MSRGAASRPKVVAMVACVAGILPAIRRRDAFDTAIAKLRLTPPPRTTRWLRCNLVAHAYAGAGGMRWHSANLLVEPAPDPRSGRGQALIGRCASPHDHSSPWRWGVYCARPQPKRDERGRSSHAEFRIGHRAPAASRPHAESRIGHRTLAADRPHAISRICDAGRRLAFMAAVTVAILHRGWADSSCTNYPRRRNGCVTGRSDHGSGQAMFPWRHPIRKRVHVGPLTHGADRRIPRRGRPGYAFRPVRRERAA